MIVVCIISNAPLRGARMEKVNTPSDRVTGLDSLRFICAMVVFFRHGAAPPLGIGLGRESLFERMSRGFYGNLWDGPAAVIVFFVISGFCIHYPFAGTANRPRLLEFYLRRFLRLTIPVAVAIPLSGLLGVKLDMFDKSVLWSLAAELIYYILYPALRLAHLKCGAWKPLIIVAYGLSVLVVLTDPRAPDYAVYGPALNWLVGLPCWLLGCALAESVRVGSAESPGAGEIWTWRIGVFAAAWLCSALKFHSPIGLPWTLNVFALLAAAWLLREIIYRKSHPPARWMESAGLWSYSLYLLHPAGLVFFARLFPAFGNPWFRWVSLCGFVLAASVVFYIVVERPSHLLARRIARAFRSSRQPG